MSNNTIAKSRRQKVFVVLEDVPGALQFPTATDLVLPAGDATMNQTPQFTDSEEKRDTLDVLARCQDALPPGDWSIPLYIRPAGTLGSAPQGEAMFIALQGLLNPATTAALSAELAADGVSLSYDTLAGGQLPASGIIQIDAELISYTGKTGTTLTGLTRGVNGTTAALHADDAAITLKSLVYRQTTSSPSLSIWIMTDHLVQAMAGCTVNQASLGVTNKGYVKMDFKGQGMVMRWAGTAVLAGDELMASDLIELAEGDAKKFSAGMYVWNATSGDNNGGAGYLISEVDTDLHALTLDEGIGEAWSEGDEIAGFLPAGTIVGQEIESRHTAVKMGGASAKFRTTDLTLGVPKQYVEDEVGCDHPEDYMEQARDISSTLKLYFRRAEARRLHDGYQGVETPIELIFGKAVGSRMVVLLPRCSLAVPEIAFESPAVALNIGVKVLGTNGEDSCEIRFE